MRLKTEENITRKNVISGPVASMLSPHRRLLAVLGGGFCGTIARYVLSSWLQAWLGKGWPYDILLINITGALLLAFVTTLADATFLVGPTRRLFINVGFLGAYTTFSSLALGDVLLFQGRQWLPALLYIVISITGGVLAIVSGDRLGLWCLSKARRPGPARMTRGLAEVLSAAPSDTIVSGEHIDMQDDLLLPDAVDEHETRQPHRQ